MTNTMKRSFILLTIIFLFGLVADSSAQLSKIDNFEDQAALVTEFDVNGLKVIYKRRPNSGTVAAGLFIRGGAQNITAQNAGIERLMLLSAIEAGNKIPRQLVRRELASTGSSIGAGTSNDYSVASLATTKADFNTVFNIFAGVLLDPAFEKEDVERNRQQTIAALNETNSTPEGALDAMQERIIYAGHPYANDVNGTAATLNSFTPAQLRAYHKKVMETQRLLFVIVGDLDPGELKTKIANTFGKLPRGVYSPKALPSLDFTKGTLDITQRAVPTNYVEGVFAAPSINNQDYYAMKVAMAVLQSLVYQEVRGRLQLSYAPDADMDSLTANTANISVSTTDPNRAVSAMLDQIKFLKERTLRKEVIDEVASFFLTRYYMSQETSAAQAAELAKYELTGGGWRRSYDFLKGAKAVTPEDITRVSKKYMTNLRFLYVGDPKVIDKSIFVAE